MSILCDVHTHTVFCDGKNTPEEMVLSAINKDCRVFGLSGHSYMAWDSAAEWRMELSDQLEYADTINALKEKYADKIKLLLGAEMDYYAEPLNFKCDYIIGSVHAIKQGDTFLEIDIAPDILQNTINEYYGGDALRFAGDYYELEAGIVDKTQCDVIGHFDLLTKFNEKFNIIDTASKKYRDTALAALDALIEEHKIFEINTGAISRGWRTKPYPEDFILRRLSEKKAAVMLTSDSHSAENIMFAFDAAEEYARACGITEFFQF